MTAPIETPAPLPASPSSPALAGALADTIEHWFDGTDLVTPSINVAVFDRSGVLFQHGVGEFCFDGRAPRVDTVYRIASMSKSFCIAAVLVLAERGLLSLDDHVSAHVPEFHDPVDRFGVVMPVTIAMFMNNSSGLPEDNGWADHELALERDELLAIVDAGLTFADRPGRGYQYSNIGFWLLGVIVENVSGEPFERFARHALLDPLGLADTRYSADDYPEGTDVAPGYGTFDEGATWFDRPYVGGGIGACAASMFSTVGDIARWSGWLSSAFDEDNADDAVLSRASRRHMQRVHTSAVAPSDRSPDLEGMGYGLGLFVENDVRFGAIAQHSGGLPGFSSNMRWHLNSGLGVIVFSNTNGVRPAIPATGILRAVLEHRDVPARRIPVWPQTLAAAAAVDAALLGSGAMLDASHVVPFSDNLLSDVPADVRDRHWATTLAETGGLAAEVPPLAERLVSAVSRAQLTWTIPGASAEIECRLELTPTVPALLQRLEVEVRKPATAATSVIRNYLPVVG